MKTRSALLLAAAVFVAFTSGTCAAQPATEFKSFALQLRPGASPAKARKSLGAPDATLGPDLWIYWNFGDPNPNSASPEFDTLVVAFENNRVSAVKITDGRVVRQLLAEAARPAKAPTIAAAPVKR